MSRYKPLTIGDLIVKKPIVQGGMGVGISLSSLAGAVAKAGGLGIISTAQIGFKEPDFEKNSLLANLRAIEKEIKKARAAAPFGAIGVNIMAVTKGFPEYVKAAVKAGADIIISGAGLPVGLPEYVNEGEQELLAAGIERPRKVKIAPIVSSPKSASVICKLWERKYHRIPDLVIIEGPLAGGHLGFSKEELSHYQAGHKSADECYDRDAYDLQIKGILDVVRGFAEKFGSKIPVVSAGGVFSREDVLHHLSLGVDGVQVGTRFVTTQECDAPDAYKQAYLKAEKKDIVITKSPVGMPGRAIRNAFLERVEQAPEKVQKCHRCIEHCDPATTPYCITKALVNAAKGQLQDALLFCGSNAYRCEKIETVAAVMEDLCPSG